MAGYITSITTNLWDRAWSHLFNVKITFPNNSTSTNLNPTDSGDATLSGGYNILASRCFSVTFGGDTSLEQEYSDTQKQHFYKDATLIKSVTLGFHDTADSIGLGVAEYEFGLVYSKETNSFQSPENIKKTFKTIEITMDNVLKNQINANIGDVIKLENAKLMSYSYPKLSWKDGEPRDIMITYTFDKPIIIQENGNELLRKIGNRRVTT